MLFSINPSIIKKSIVKPVLAFFDMVPACWCCCPWQQGGWAGKRCPFGWLRFSGFNKRQNLRLNIALPLQIFLRWFFDKITNYSEKGKNIPHVKRVRGRKRHSQNMDWFGRCARDNVPIDWCLEGFSGRMIAMTSFAQLTRMSLAMLVNWYSGEITPRGYIFKAVSTVFPPNVPNLFPTCSSYTSHVQVFISRYVGLKSTSFAVVPRNICHLHWECDYLRNSAVVNVLECFVTGSRCLTDYQFSG